MQFGRGKKKKMKPKKNWMQRVHCKRQAGRARKAHHQSNMHFQFGESTVHCSCTRQSELATDQENTQDRASACYVYLTFAQHDWRYAHK